MTKLARRRRRRRGAKENPTTAGQLAVSSAIVAGAAGATALAAQATDTSGGKDPYAWAPGVPVGAAGAALGGLVVAAVSPKWRSTGLWTAGVGGAVALFSGWYIVTHIGSK